MIKINLLNDVTRASSGGGGGGAAPAFADSFEDIKEIQKQGSLKLFVILLPAVAMYLYEWQNLPSLTKEKARLVRSLQDMKSYNAKTEGSVREIKKFKEDEDRIQQRIAVLDKLSKNRTNEIKSLKLLADIIPEKAWLESVAIKDNRANIVGLAVNYAEVNNLAERLKSNILIADFQLVKITEEKSEGAAVWRFEFNCLLEGRK